MYFVIFKDIADVHGVSRKRLIETALENCEIYRYEYILNKPTQVLENLLETTLDELVVRGLVKLPQVCVIK